MEGPWKDKKVAVAGGAGFVGSHVVDQLVAAGARVVAVDDGSSGDWSRLDSHASVIECHHRDLIAPDLAGLFEGVDVVMDLAGKAPGLTPDEDRHDELYEANLAVADAVLKGVIEAGVPRLLVVSSSCVYPDDAVVPTPEISLECSEPEQANRGYGLAKREIERRALVASKAAGFEVAVVRPFNIYGGRDTAVGRGAHVIPSLIERLLQPGSEVLVWGSGDQTRSFMHAGDVAAAILLVADRASSGSVVNVGSGEEYSMVQLIDRLQMLTGTEKQLVFDPHKPEGALRKACDASLLKRLTGFEPKVSFEDGLREMVELRLGSRLESPEG
ncbi:NAD-dependent epimerase/dehydratase family protein [Haloferula sp.]|uniref:NAD-dependent epimerase/dehydratase family protein n=1 Tax=Haloferula sp. TaxID=2497595 RepID=UPI00329BB5F4